MKPQEIKEFLQSIKYTDIEELHYESGDDSLYFKKANTDEKLSESGVKQIQVETIKTEEKKSDENNLVVIKSSMVGTFISAPSNEKPPFVKKGTIVKAGQKIGQIEAMTIVKDVFTNVSGRIEKVLVSNGESVEYGKELFLIDTSK